MSLGVVIIALYISLQQAKDSVIAELTKECSSLKLELSEPRTHLQGASHPTNTAVSWSSCILVPSTRIMIIFHVKIIYA